MSSVHKCERSVSRIDFLDNARNLEDFTMTQCTKLPKRYAQYISIPLFSCAWNILAWAKKANSIFPTTKRQAIKRREYFDNIVEELNVMVSQIEFIKHRKFPISMDVMKNWMELVDLELRLIKGVIKSDQERYKNLPDT